MKKEDREEEITADSFAEGFMVGSLFGSAAGAILIVLLRFLFNS